MLFGFVFGDVVIGDFVGKWLVFLVCYGESYSLLLYWVNYCVNLWVLYYLGVCCVIGVNVVGGICYDMGLWVIVVLDQVIDYIYGCYISFCDVEGVEVKYIDFSELYIVLLCCELLVVVGKVGIVVIDGGCYGVIQGLWLEICVEIVCMKCDGCDLVGMIGMFEVVLVCELEFDYVCFVLVVNFVVGCGDEVEISIEEIFVYLVVVIVEVLCLLVVMLVV